MIGLIVETIPFSARFLEQRNIAFNDGPIVNVLQMTILSINKWSY